MYSEAQLCSFACDERASRRTTMIFTQLPEARGCFSETPRQSVKHWGSFGPRAHSRRERGHSLR